METVLTKPDNARPESMHMYWLDLVLFKLSWAALVYFQASAIVPVLGIIALKIVTWPDIGRSLVIILLTIILGTGMDLALSLAGVFIFPDSILPLWLVVLWISFALTLPRGFAFLSRLHPWIQSCVGVLAGCIGYLAGEWLGAVSFGYSLTITLGVLAMLWSMLLPGLFLIQKQIKSANKTS